MLKTQMTLKERKGCYFLQVKNGDFIKFISATGLKVKQQQQQRNVCLL